MKRKQKFSLNKQDGFKLFLLAGAIIVVLLTAIVLNTSKISQNSRAEGGTKLCKAEYAKKAYKACSLSANTTQCTGSVYVWYKGGLKWLQQYKGIECGKQRGAALNCCYVNEEK
jgi:hypothetical protein